ncbi:MAG: hypothetical protein WCA79_21510 [Anaerolineales bacterium]
MKPKLILLIICFLVASLAILYLYNQKSQPKFGSEYNAERQKLSIPTIPQSWSFIVNDYAPTWFDP